MRDNHVDTTRSVAHTELANSRFLGCQPIYDRDQNIYGHELLFRSGEVNAFSGDPEEATRQVIDNCLLLMPRKQHGVAFINCTRLALLSGIVTLLPPTETVLEILENVEPDDEVIACCRALKQQGYRFALDDFTYDGITASLLEFADFVKIDFQATTAVTRRQIYRRMNRRHQKCIAEKVETLQEVESARAEGCEFFQGYFFSRPVMSKVKVIPKNQMVYLRILSLLMREDVNLFELEKLTKSDTGLCFRLLRLVNSALYPTHAPITSILSAINLVGMNEMRKLILVSIQTVKAEGSSKTLLALALERAKFCEQLSPFLDCEASSLYLLGMFSLLDLMLGIPMSEILAALPLEEQMRQALMGENNVMRVALDLVICRERGNWNEAAEQAQLHGLSEGTASSIHFESVLWARETYHQLSAL